MHSRPDRSEEPTEQNPSPRLLTIPEAARYLGVSKYSVRGMAQRGQLPTVPVCARLRVPADALERLLSQTHQSAAENQ
jgi:excisionase family DNA binding protein